MPLEAILQLKRQSLGVLAQVVVLGHFWVGLEPSHRRSNQSIKQDLVRDEQTGIEPGMLKKFHWARVGVHHHLTTGVRLYSPLGDIPIVVVLRIAVDSTVAVQLIALIDESLLVVERKREEFRLHVIFHLEEDLLLSSDVCGTGQHINHAVYLGICWRDGHISGLVAAEVLLQRQRSMGSVSQIPLHDRGTIFWDLLEQSKAGRQRLLPVYGSSS